MDTEVYEWIPILKWIATFNPLVINILTILGTIVVVGTLVDRVIPDKYDKGFMQKLRKAPIIGSLLAALSKFSPFNHK